MIRLVPLVLLALAGCSPKGSTPDTGDDTPTDTADDTALPDCVPTDEVPYDGIDQDCDGADWADVDGDGFDSAEAGGADCDDGDAAIHPGADELCDGVDNDCDDATEEAGTATWTPEGGAPEDWTEVMTGSPSAVSLDAPGALALCGGPWYANLTVTADVSIQGFDAVIDGADAASVVDVEGDRLTVDLTGLTLQGGLGSAAFSYGEGLGGGVACVGEDTQVTVTDSALVANEGYYGGGLGSDGCTVLLDGVTASGNTATYGGGALLLHASAAIQDSVLTENVAGYLGGGLSFSPDGTTQSLSIQDSTLSGNTAEHGGGALLRFVEPGSTVELTGMTLSDNTSATVGGGLSLYGDGTVTVTDSTVSDNTADEGGGAFWVQEGSLALVDTRVSGNAAPEGGGVYIRSESAISCLATAPGSGGFSSNTADIGGALFEAGPDWSAPVEELLSTEGCEWGTEADGDDNTPDDLSVCHSNPEGSTGGEMWCDDLRYVIDGVEDFSCTDGRCGDERTGSLEPLEAGETEGLVAVGAVFEATGDATLDVISAYVELTENTSLDFSLLSRAPGETGDWTLEWRSSGTSRAGADWRTPATDMAGVPLRAGTSYAFVVGVFRYDGTMTPYEGDPSERIDGIGAVTGAWRDESFADDYGYPGDAVPDASLPGEAPLAVSLSWYAVGDDALR